MAGLDHFGGGAFDADAARGDPHAALAEAMAGPLAAGARAEDIPIGPGGATVVPAGLYEPLLLVAPAADLGSKELTVRGTYGAGPGAIALPPVRFAPLSEALGFVMLHRPALGPGEMTEADTKLSFVLEEEGAALPQTQVAARLRLRVLSGRFGRLLHLMQAETPRLRRTMRQVGAARALSGPGAAAGAILDRLGQEVSVPRLDSRILGKAGRVVTEDARETDAQYRARLALYRPFVMPTRAAALSALNAGAPADKPRFAIEERDNPIHVALRLVAVDADAADAAKARRNYQRWLRDTVLIDPTEDVPQARRMNSAARAQERQLRKRLSERLDFAGPSRAMAPALANALDRACAAAGALGRDLDLTVLRAQSDEDGSRWELGLAAEVKTPDPGFLADLAQRARNMDLARIADPRARGVVARLKASLGPGAPDASWLLGAAGMRTVHALSPDALMLSHFTTGGLVITGQGDLGAEAARAGTGFGAALLAENDAETNAALSHALSGGPGGWGAGQPGWTRVAAADFQAEAARLSLPPAAIGARLGALGLPRDFDAEHFGKALERNAAGLAALLRLSPARAAGMEAGEDAAWDAFAAELEVLARNGAASAVLMARQGGGLTLAVSSAALPPLAANLGGRRSSGFVWRAAPITEGYWQARGVGGRGEFRGARRRDGPGLAAIAVFAYARQGLTDPFEYRVKAADPGLTLSIAEYERMMNTLRRVTPAGVQANTWEIRRAHVAPEEGAAPAPLAPGLARAYRPWRRPRFAGGGGG